MKDFANYEGRGRQDTPPVDWTAEAQRAAERYNGRNEGELIREIYARAAASRRAGTLSDAEIDGFYNTFAPMLDAGKRKRLQKLLAQLKSM